MRRWHYCILVAARSSSRCHPVVVTEHMAVRSAGRMEQKGKLEKMKANLGQTEHCFPPRNTTPMSLDMSKLVGSATARSP
jgi:hypothetical protein